jgi:hypothetical protein
LNWRSPAGLTAIGVGATLVVALTVIVTLLQTSGHKAISANAALIGALVALGGVFTTQLVSIALDDRRTQESRELEAQRAHEAALQNYVEQVGTLLIEQQPLREASSRDNLSTVVRAQTLTVLQGLDPDRKRTLLQFLYESELIYNKSVVKDKRKRVVRLRSADLSGASLFMANLPLANLHGTNLRNADLRDAYLRRADLSGANLRGADLRGADLRDANLYRVDLRDANLRNADLYSKKSSGMSGVMRSVVYQIAGLRWVTRITNQEELEQQARSLEGAILPDGSKHP